MKHTTIFSALIMIFLAVGISGAQSGTYTLTFQGGIFVGSRDVTTVSFTGLENHNLQVFEALVPGPAENCFESTDFSAARPVGSDRASLVYDAATGTYTVRWSVKRENRDTCRVLLVDDGDSDGRDFLLWQRNIGNSGGLTEGVSGKSDAPDARGDGSVRFISYSVAVDTFNAQPLSLKIKNPTRPDEVIEAAFQAPANSVFPIFEVLPTARNEAECLGTTDFTGAVPADPDRTQISYDPVTGTWYLKNSNSPGAPIEPCRVIFNGGDVDLTDFNLIRANFGTTGAFAEDGFAKTDPAESRPGNLPSVATYSMVVDRRPSL